MYCNLHRFVCCKPVFLSVRPVLCAPTSCSLGHHLDSMEHDYRQLFIAHLIIRKH